MSYLGRVLIMTVLVVPAAYCLIFRMTTGHWFPVRQIETLVNPIEVKGWTAAGLDLSDGRSVALLGVEALPIQSSVLSEVVRQGVEITPDGQVYGLVKVHHWCGNDPVREHLARVNLSDLLVFLGEVTPVKPLGETQKRLLAGNTSRFTEHGWDIGQYSTFHGWRSAALWDE
jgi:hypothetical protein